MFVMLMSNMSKLTMLQFLTYNKPILLRNTNMSEQLIPEGFIQGLLTGVISGVVTTYILLMIFAERLARVGIRTLAHHEWPENLLPPKKKPDQADWWKPNDWTPDEEDLENS